MLLQAEATVDLQTKVVHCTLSTPHNIPVNIKFKDNIQQITPIDVCMGEETHLCTGSMYIQFSGDIHWTKNAGL